MVLHTFGLAGLLLASRASAIDTVTELNVPKYLGRWYQAYGDAYSMAFMPGANCVTADYGLDAATGNITVVNANRLLSPTGDLDGITGYAYLPDASQPGKLKVQLSGVPSEGDYWVVALGPEEYGAEGLYEYAVVTDRKQLSLFVLCRDVAGFEEKYASQVLSFLAQAGFDGPLTAPIKTVQEGCTPFTPQEALTAATAEEESSLLGDLIAGIPDMQWPQFNIPQVVSELSLPLYAGRWYQMYGSLTATLAFERNGVCITADYTLEDDGSVGVTNTQRLGSPTGELESVQGEAQVEDPDKPGQLMVRFDESPLPFAPYWVLALGPPTFGEEGQYEWSIVSDPLRAFLFVLARNPATFAADYQEEVLSLLSDLGFAQPWNLPLATEQDGCQYPDPPAPDSVRRRQRQRQRRQRRRRRLAPSAAGAAAVGRLGYPSSEQQQLESSGLRVGRSRAPRAAASVPVAAAAAGRGLRGRPTAAASASAFSGSPVGRSGYHTGLSGLSGGGPGGRELEGTARDDYYYVYPRPLARHGGGQRDALRARARRGFGGGGGGGGGGRRSRLRRTAGTAEPGPAAV